ncbi:NDP-hexose 2,3-dehydratase family protein [Candidatus Uhrbacteria bacterium]|nr:NDP-hexose 2,3-dehydratase family protein [Candidatus Uhrbacteria bacterium]
MIGIYGAETFFMFLADRARALAMETEDCLLSELAPAWIVDADSVRRPDGGFFTVRGRHVRRAAGREVSGWSQPLIFGDSGGTVALAICSVVGEGDLYLVRVKAEPGAMGIEVDGQNTRVIVSPTLQFSRSNLERHGRALRGETDERGQSIKPVPLAGILNEHRFRVSWQPVPEDPGRFADKVNRAGFIHAPSTDAFNGDITELPEEQRHDFAWVNLEVLRMLCSRGYANSHLRSVMAMLA